MTKVIQEFFLLLSIPENIDVKLENRYNINEGGIIEGLGFNGLALESLEKKKAFLKTLGFKVLDDNY